MPPAWLMTTAAKHPISVMINGALKLRVAQSAGHHSLSWHTSSPHTGPSAGPSAALPDASPTSEEAAGRWVSAVAVHARDVSGVELGTMHAATSVHVRVCLSPSHALHSPQDQLDTHACATHAVPLHPWPAPHAVTPTSRQLSPSKLPHVSSDVRLAQPSVPAARHSSVHDPERPPPPPAAEEDELVLVELTLSLTVLLATLRLPSLALNCTYSMPLNVPLLVNVTLWRVLSIVTVMLEVPFDV